MNARWFPARGRRAVVLLPHWNSDALAYTGLCRVLNLMGIAVLRLSMPYHEIRMPADTRRADYAVSANVGRTLDACRQAVVDVRCCFEWLQQKGYSRLGHPVHQPGFLLLLSCGGAHPAHPARPLSIMPPPMSRTWSGMDNPHAISVRDWKLKSISTAVCTVERISPISS